MSDINASNITEPCPTPNSGTTFIDHALEWLESISQEDANKFLNGMSLNSALVLYKHFPDNQLVKEVLQSKI